jgi:flagellar protein FlgJ
MDTVSVDAVRPRLELPPDEPDARRARLREAASQFEAIFLSLMVKEMLASTPSLFGEGAGSEVYRGLFETALGQALAGKGFGLAETIEGRLAPVLDGAAKGAP